MQIARMARPLQIYIWYSADEEMPHEPHRGWSTSLTQGAQLPAAAVRTGSCVRTAFKPVGAAGAAAAALALFLTLAGSGSASSASSSRAVHLCAIYQSATPCSLGLLHHHTGRLHPMPLHVHTCCTDVCRLNLTTIFCMSGQDRTKCWVCILRYGLLWPC